MKLSILLQGNLWFGGPPAFNNYKYGRRPRSGPDTRPYMTHLEPWQGYTASNNAIALAAELEMLARYVPPERWVIYQQWIKPGNSIDRNLPLWLRVFEEYPEARWCLFYDPFLAASQRGFGDRPHDWSSQPLRDLWREDLRHLSMHGQHRQYWKMDGRPVLYLWAVGTVALNMRACFEEAKPDWWLLADAFGSPTDPPACTDAVTGFTAIPSGTPAGVYSVDWALAKMHENIRRFRPRWLTFPACSLAYDDRQFMAAQGTPQNRKAVVPRGRRDYKRVIRELIEAADPRAPCVGLGTLNNWAESAVLLPSKRRNPFERRFWRDRVGNPGKTPLKVLRTGIREAA